MECPTCGKPIGDGQAFCGECGARIEASEPVAATPPAQPAPPAPPVYNEAAYQQQYAQPGPQQQYAQPYQQQPPPKKKTGLIIAVLAVVFVFVVGGVVGGIFLIRSLADDTETITPPLTNDPGTDTGDDVIPSDGYATPEDALAAEYPADWVFTLQSDDDSYMIYWVGPPNSEYVDEVVVGRTADGSWVVREVIPIEMSDISGEITPEDEAVDTVKQFLNLIMQDRPLEAQQLCVSPFSEDPASASYSNGDFISYEIVDVVGATDMTFLVHTVEEWRGWDAEGWEYYVVPTELGYRIADLRPYTY
ncbi:MAG: zinc ribbon domain-containing protein [Coriobacteriia bacterium]|nr:zinc ribbon domain-containing protein [Coriobacteriia bacterium]